MFDLLILWPSWAFFQLSQVFHLLLVGQCFSLTQCSLHFCNVKAKTLFLIRPQKYVTSSSHTMGFYITFESQWHPISHQHFASA